MLFLQLLIVIQVCTITSVDLIQQIIPFPICFLSFLFCFLLFSIFLGKLTVFKKNYFNFVDPHFLSCLHDDVGGVHKFATKKRWKTKQNNMEIHFRKQKNNRNWLREISMNPFKMLNGRVNTWKCDAISFGHWSFLAINFRYLLTWLRKMMIECDFRTHRDHKSSESFENWKIFSPIKH